MYHQRDFIISVILSFYMYHQCDLCEGKTQLIEILSALLEKLVETGTKVAGEVYYHLMCRN